MAARQQVCNRNAAGCLFANKTQGTQLCIQQRNNGNFVVAVDSREAEERERGDAQPAQHSFRQSARWVRQWRASECPVRQARPETARGRANRTALQATAVLTTCHLGFRARHRMAQRCRRRTSVRRGQRAIGSDRLSSNHTHRQHLHGPPPVLSVR